jgi:hypothetical protein
MSCLDFHSVLISPAGADAPAMTASVFTTVPAASGLAAERERMPGARIRA